MGHQQLEELIKRINQTKIDKLNSIIIALDIKNAFNSMKPEVVIQKLSTLTKVADNFLRKRKIIYEKDEVKISKTLTSGSPHYWNVTISDLHTKFRSRKDKATKALSLTKKELH